MAIVSIGMKWEISERMGVFYLGPLKALFSQVLVGGIGIVFICEEEDPFMAHLDHTKERAQVTSPEEMAQQWVGGHSPV